MTDRPVPWSSLPDNQNPVLVYLASLGSLNSRRAMRHALRWIVRFVSQGQMDDPARFPWHLLRYKHTAAIRSELIERVKFSTANNYLAALRGVLHTTADLGLMSRDDCLSACRFKPVRGYSLPTGRDLSQGELLALVDACKRDSTLAGARDVAIIGIMYTCGLRRSEVVRLDLADFDQESGRLLIRSGKGNKDRSVYVTGGALLALCDWLAVRGAEPGALFVPINKGGNITGYAYASTDLVWSALRKRGHQAGLRPFSPHDLRRTFVGDLLDHGADITTVQRLAGHSSPTTTGRYDRRGEKASLAAQGLIHFPYSNTE